MNFRGQPQKSRFFWYTRMAQAASVSPCLSDTAALSVWGSQGVQERCSSATTERYRVIPSTFLSSKAIVQFQTGVMPPPRWHEKALLNYTMQKAQLC